MQQEIHNLIAAQVDATHIDVQLSGNHCTVVVVSEQFEGLSPVKKQQKIYQCLNDKIASGEIHAVNIRAYTPAQWQSQS